MTRSALSACAVVLLCLAGMAAAQTQTSATPTTSHARIDRWREDLRVLAEELPRRHINLFTNVTREQFLAGVNEIESNLHRLTEPQVHIALKQLIARIGDGHTTLSLPPDAPPWGRYPINLVYLRDGYYINGATEPHVRLLGSRLVRIGSLDAEEAARRVATLFPVENDAIFHRGAAQHLVRPEVLEELGIVPDRDRARIEVELDGGERVTDELSPISRTNPPRFHFRPDATSVKLPRVQLSRPEYYWFEHLPESKTLYIRYDRCANDPKKLILWFNKELFDFADAHREQIERVIVDLRRNAGGNSLVFRPVVVGLQGRDWINQPGRLFVLIGPGTYSSAMLNALELKEKTNALLVGQPTGQKPNSFGEIKSFQLPHSRITVQYSTKRFEMIAGDDPPSLIPDLLIEPTPEAYFSGRDVTLERVLAYERP